MSKTSDYIQGILDGRGQLLGPNTSFTSSELASISAATDEDSTLFFEASCICFANSISGLERGLLTWPVIQAYYSVYFSLHSILASNQFILLRRGKSPHLLSVTPFFIRKLRSSAHDSLIRVFRDQLPYHKILSQEIDGQISLKWVKELRERYNYQTPGFVEPDWPDCLDVFKRYGARKLIAIYFEEPDRYAFDPDHAVLALPSLCLLESQGAARPIDKNKADHCKAKARDSYGPIPPIEKFFAVCAG
jgi:hypothetical protein